jgi:integrase
MKIAKILELYLDWAEREICSVERTRSAVKALNKAFGHLDHTRLSPAALRSYRASEGLAVATINRELGVLRAGLHQAQTNGLIRTVIAVEKRPGEAQRVTWLSPIQTRALIAEAETASESIERFIRVSLGTAQRLEAVLSLRWTQVDRQQGVIWFADCDLSHAKRRKGRGAVHISPGMGTLLDRLRLGNESPWVLTNRNGSRYQDIDRPKWKAITTAAGLPGLRPHDLRHTCATNLIRLKTPLIDVSRLLGHANTTITEKIYVNYQPEFLAEAVSRLDALVA